MRFKREAVEGKRSGTKLHTQRPVSRQNKRRNGQAGVKTVGHAASKLERRWVVFKIDKLSPGWYILISPL